MKVRHDFVTNSSSSSFILAFDSKADGLQQIDDLKHKYDSDYVDQLLLDFSNEKPFSAEHIREKFRDEFENEASYFLSFGSGGWWSNDKKTFQSEWEKAHPNASHRDYYESPERQAAIEEYVEDKLKKLSDAVARFPYLVELEYEDHSDAGSALEHDILPNCDFVVESFSHH